MAVQKANTPHWLNIGADDAWPQWDEDAYVGAANNQADAARKALQGTDATRGMTEVVDENMQGQFADAAVNTFVNRGAQLTNHSEKHSNNALITGLGAQNLLMTKAQINAVAERTEGEIEALKTQAVAQQWTQNELDDAFNQVIDAARTEVQTIKSNHDQTEEGLNSQLNSGEAPAVPSTMPSAPAGGNTPRLEGLDADVESAMGNALGTGGGDLSSMAGMAQGLLSPLTGALTSPPGLDSATQLGGQGLQALQSLLGQGVGGDQVTPEQLDELLSNQGEPEDKDKDDKPEPRDRDDKPEPRDRPEPPPHPEGAPPKPDEAAPTETSSGAPSPAAEPVSAAPPASAMQPSVHLSSGDATAAASQSPTTGLSAGAPGAGTSALGSAPAPMGVGAGAAGAGAGAGAPMGGMVGGMAPMGGQPNRAQRPNLTTTAAPTEQGKAGSLDVVGVLAQSQSPVAPAPAPLVPADLAAKRAIRDLLAALRAAGRPAHVAVAVLPDGSVVYASRDSLGSVPGVVLPAGVQALGDLPTVNDHFRADWTGRLPGEALAVAGDNGVIPEPLVIMATENGDLGVIASASDLRGALV